MLQPVLLWVVPASRVCVLLPVFVLLNTECIGNWPGLRQPFALPLGVVGFRLYPFHGSSWERRHCSSWKDEGGLLEMLLHSRTRLNWLNSFTNLCLDVIILVKMPSSSVAGWREDCVLLSWDFMQLDFVWIVFPEEKNSSHPLPAPQPPADVILNEWIVLRWPNPCFWWEFVSKKKFSLLDLNLSKIYHFALLTWK